MIMASNKVCSSAQFVGSFIPFIHHVCTYFLLLLVCNMLVTLQVWLHTGEFLRNCSSAVFQQNLLLFVIVCDILSKAVLKMCPFVYAAEYSTFSFLF